MAKHLLTVSVERDRQTESKREPEGRERNRKYIAYHLNTRGESIIVGPKLF